MTANATVVLGVRVQLSQRRGSHYRHGANIQLPVPAQAPERCVVLAIRVLGAR